MPRSIDDHVNLTRQLVDDAIHGMKAANEEHDATMLGVIKDMKAHAADRLHKAVSAIESVAQTLRDEYIGHISILEEMEQNLLKPVRNPAKAVKLGAQTSSSELDTLAEELLKYSGEKALSLELAADELHPEWTESFTQDMVTRAVNLQFT